MPLPALITAADLKLALTPRVYEQVFDDDMDGTVADDEQQVTLVIERAHAEVLSYLPRAWGDGAGSIPTDVPPLLKSAELDYAVALSLERHPEYVRSVGEDARERRWARAERKMERIVEGAQVVVENAPPAAAAAPILQGGIIYNPNPRRTIVDGSDDTFNGGDF